MSEYLKKMRENKDTEAEDITEIEYKIKNIETYLERLNKKIVN